MTGAESSVGAGARAVKELLSDKLAFADGATGVEDMAALAQSSGAARSWAKIS
jgi:hypothetical protein